MDHDSDHTVPSLRPPHEAPPLRTQAALHEHWRALMGELGFSSRRLWVLFLDRELRASEVLVQIDDIPERPVDAQVDGLMTMLLHVRDEHDLGRVAILLSRPGAGGLRASDREWGRALVAAARRTGVPLAPVHLADDEALVPLAGDDLVVTS